MNGKNLLIINIIGMIIIIVLIVTIKENKIFVLNIESARFIITEKTFIIIRLIGS